MADAPRPTLRTVADGIEGMRLTNIAWIRQAEQHNAKSRALPGARENVPIYAEVSRLLYLLAALSTAVGGDDKVEAWLERAVAKTTEAA